MVRVSNLMGVGGEAAGEQISKLGGQGDLSTKVRKEISARCFV